MESSICLFVCYGHKKSVLWWKTASMWVINYSNPVIYPKDLYIEIFTGKRELERNIRERGIFLNEVIQSQQQNPHLQSELVMRVTERD